MSAQPIPRPRHGIVKVPYSFFTTFLQIAVPSQRACFGLVLDLTIGLAAIGKPRQWAPITRDQFAAVSHVDPNYVMERVAGLVAAGWIQERGAHDSRGMEYAISPELAKETKGERITGRCSECKYIGQFATAFIPMPRTYFSILTPALDNDALLAIAVISRFSHERAWSAETGLVPKWIELDLGEFERLSGIEARSVINGIKKAAGLNLIEVQHRKGKPSLYRTLPENWADLKPKPLRLVDPPIKPKREPKANEPRPKPQENPADPKKVVQSSPNGLCPACCHIVEIEPVSKAELAQAETKAVPESTNRPPRAGPTRERTPKRSRTDGMWDVVKRWAGE